MIQLSEASSRTRNTNARDSPTARACRALRALKPVVRIAMKTMLSMPRTISSAVSVSSAAQAFASERSSTMSGPARQKPDGEEIDRDGAETPDHRRRGRQVGTQSDERQNRP